MALFLLRDKEQEAGQLFETFPHSLINVSAELYNALARSALREIGEHRLKMITTSTLMAIEAECYKENPQTTIVVVPRTGERVYLRLSVLDVGRQKDGWERPVTVKVTFPITGHVECQDRFLNRLVQTIGLGTHSIAVEGNGLVTRVTLFADNVPVEWSNPSGQHGNAWKYYVRRGEVL